MLRLSYLRNSILSFLGMLYIRFVYHTCRWRYINFDILNAYDRKGPFILCFWHQRLLMLPYAWPISEPFKMLISSHSDGQLIARIIKYFNIGTIHGSSNKKGAEALLKLLKSLKKGVTVGITPDGPKGPCQKAKPGLYVLSKLSKIPVIPIVYATSRRKILKTWDHFHLPLPFGKGILMYADPIASPLNESQDEWLTKVEQKMNQLLETAERLLNDE